MEPAFHLSLPILITIALGVPLDIALFLAPLSLLFDLDLFLGPHRRLHSIVILMIIAVPTAILVTTVFPNAMLSYLTGLFYAGIHLLLDIFSGEVALFYPLSPKGYGMKMKMKITNTPLRISPIQMGITIVPEIQGKKGSYTLLSGQGVVAILLVAIAAISRSGGLL